MDTNAFTFNPFDFKRLETVAGNLQAVMKQAEEVAITKLLETISVTPPYFAFTKAYRFNDILIAPVEKEQLVTFESTPLTSAEASRHLAILGSCVVAAEQTERKHYIAHKARFRLGEMVGDVTKLQGALYAIALPLFVSKKEAAACTMLVTEKGQVVFKFKVGYQVIPRKTFQRVFSDFVMDTPPVDFNPYRKIPDFERMSIKGNVLTAQLPDIPKAMCAGHFDGVPMLPIGIFAYMANNAIGTFLREITGSRMADLGMRYHLIGAEMDVYLPIALHQGGVLEITYHGLNNDNYLFSWITKNPQGDTINTMTISFACSHQLASVKQLQYYEAIEHELERYRILCDSLSQENRLLKERLQEPQAH